MGKVIAVAGKGGVGKTTIVALTIRYLREHGMSPILAVDCDPNTNLNMLLDMKVNKTIGSIRENGKTARPSGMSLHDFLDYQINMHWLRVIRLTLSLWADRRARGVIVRQIMPFVNAFQGFL